MERADCGIVIVAVVYRWGRRGREPGKLTKKAARQREERGWLMENEVRDKADDERGRSQ